MIFHVKLKLQMLAVWMTNAERGSSYHKKFFFFTITYSFFQNRQKLKTQQNLSKPKQDSLFAWRVGLGAKPHL